MTRLVLVANAGDGTISALRLHDTEGHAHLDPLATSGDLPGCGTFAVDVARGLVYAAYKGEPAGIATLHLDGATGRLTEVTRRDVEGSMTYLSLTADGGALLGVSYGGGFGVVWPVADGALGDPHSRFEHANLHCVVVADTTAYAVSLGEDLVAQFALGQDGGLAPLDPPTVGTPEGSGPRHLVVDGTNAYLTTEYSGEAIRYQRAADGTLTRAESVTVVDPAEGLSHSRFGADPEAEHLIWGADVHRAKGFLITSERSSSKLTTTALGADGRLGDIVGYTPTGKQPRSFTVTPDGRYAVVVGEKSAHASLLRVEDDGTLTEVDRAGVGRGANWVRIL